MRKDFTHGQIQRTVQATKEAGVQAGLFILIGYPGERLIDLLKTLKMIRNLSPHYCGSSVAFPIKGTPFYEDVKDVLMPDYAWSRRNENRSSFKGRYPSLFYWFGIRLINNWAAFWRFGSRRDSMVKRALHVLKFIVTGSAVIGIGCLYDLKYKIFPDPVLLSKESGSTSATKGKRG